MYDYYRCLLCSCSYYMEDFYYRSILFDNGHIALCSEALIKCEQVTNKEANWQWVPSCTPIICRKSLEEIPELEVRNTSKQQCSVMYPPTTFPLSENLILCIFITIWILTAYASTSWRESHLKSSKVIVTATQRHSDFHFLLYFTALFKEMK